MFVSGTVRVIACDAPDEMPQFQFQFLHQLREHLNQPDGLPPQIVYLLGGDESLFATTTQ
ncbi:MAG: sister chromatid cohesion protein PDS5 [Acidobacteriota bacterium]|nr:sister chromatid cohesion protein PDS5 [Acidobacteriota bacterium]